VLATRSAGKLRELRPLFRDAGLDVIDLVEAGVAESSAEESVEAHDTIAAGRRSRIPLKEIRPASYASSPGRIAPAGSRSRMVRSSVCIVALLTHVGRPA